MPIPQPNGPRGNQDPIGSAPPERWSLAAVIAEAETLRGLLQDAGTRSARLLTALKLQRRQSRAVQQAMASLRELQLDP